MAIDPFLYEIELKASGAGRKRNSILPYLHPWQYNDNLYPEDNFYAMINANKNWVYVCSARNSSTVANTPLRLYVAKNKKGSKLKGYPTRSVDKSHEVSIRENAFLQNIPSVRKASEFEEILDHPFLDLKRNVNGFMNNFDLVEMTQLYQELTGNAYWHIIEDRMGVPREIWIIPPQNCKIIPDKKKFISGYKYDVSGGEPIDLSEKSIIHFKMPNPKNLYYGSAPFISIAEEFNLNQKINDYETAMFANGGTLSGLFETDESLGDHEFERLKNEIKQSFTGTRNAGKMPLLDNGLKYKPLGTSPKEMSYLGGREYIKECVLNAYGLALGMFSKEANRANVDGAIYQYTKSTIQPRLRRMEEKLNEKLIWRYDEKLFVAFDNPIPEDREYKLNERIKHIGWGIQTINEVRSEMGKEPYKDSFYNNPIIPVNMTNSEMIMQSISDGNGEGNIVSDSDKLKTILSK